MERLSVTIITKNEEARLPDALRSVAFADEVVVVDCGSTDRTVEIARGLGATVIHHDWPGHVAQKNYAVKRASHRWVLSLDADERVSPELAERVRAALASPAAAGYRVRRRTWYLGRWIAHCGWYPDARVRLFDRERARWGGIDPHDLVEVNGPVADLDADLLHYSYHDLADHLRTINDFTTIAARRYFELGRRCRATDLVFRPVLAFLNKYVMKLGFLDGTPGLVVCLLHGYYVLLKYAKLWELAHARRD
jgi:glycosyltransferase involved in cell wall biosynthesis